jgi:hypothetical protein
MRIDLEYLASMLDVFLNSEKAHIDLNEFEKSGVNISTEDKSAFSEKFIFHMQIAIDNKLIGQRNGPAYDLKDVGVNQSMDGHETIVVKPIRLTQFGHDFACTLNNKEVLLKLKSEFKDAPFNVIFEGGQKLLQHFMKKKLDAILE